MTVLFRIIFLLTILFHSPLGLSQGFKNRTSIEDFNLQQQNPFVNTDKTRIGIFGGVHPNLTSNDRLLMLGISYARRYSSFWLDTTVAHTYGAFRRFSSNNPSATGAASLDELASEKNTNLTFGLGLGYESQYTSDFFSIPHFYEFIAADLTYNIYKEKFSGKTFTGPGLIAKFSSYKKFGNAASIGMHLNYALAMVKRSQDNDSEDSSERSLTLGTFVLGLDMSFYL